MNLRIGNIILILLACFIYSTAIGQKDSLLNLLNNEKSVAAKHKLAGTLYWNYLYKDIDFSDSITSVAIRLAEDADNDSLRSGSLHMKATVKLVKAEYDSSQLFIQQIHAIVDRNNFIERKASNFALEGLLHYYKGEFNESLEKHFAALEIQKTLKDTGKQLKTLNNIGISYERLGEYGKAISYYRQGLEMVPASDLYSMASFWSNIGAAQVNSGELEIAKTSLLKAKSFVKPEFHLSLINDVDNGLAKVYKETGELDQAMMLAKQIQKRAINSKDFFRQVRMLELMGSIFIAKKLYPAAIISYEKALTLGKEKGVGESSLNSYTDLNFAYQALGQHENAVEAMDSILSIKNNLFNKEKLAITENLNLKYQTAIKDKKIQEAKLANEKKTNQRNLAISGLLILLAGGAFFWQRMKIKQLAQQKTTIIQQKRIEDLEKEHKILSMSAMLEGQEKERFRIAQELHDGLGSLLASVKAHYSIIQSEIKQLEKLNVFDKAQKMMDNACDEVRRISHNLMPPILSTQGLPSALQNLVSDFRLTHNLEISIDIQRMENRLPINKEIVLYRVCQELLNNIHKHAEATKVEISLYGLDENIQLIVEDNGKGYDVDKIKPGLGLTSIQSRVEFLGGQVDVDSKEKEGTTVSISILR